jgi:hypothetical protein
MFCYSLKPVGKLPPPTVAGAGGTVIVRTNPPAQGTTNRISVNNNQTASVQPSSASMNGTGDPIRSVCFYSVPQLTRSCILTVMYVLYASCKRPR